MSPTPVILFCHSHAFLIVSSTTPQINMSVCQERFFANGTTTCVRYPNIFECEKTANAMKLTFECVPDGMDFGSNGNLGGVPRELAQPYMCNTTVCPTTNSGSVTKAGVFVVATLFASIALY